MLDIEKLYKPPRSRELHPDGCISKYDRYRTLEELDADSGIEQDINRESGLQGETLVRKGMMKKRKVSEQIRIAPEINIIKIGDTGR